MHSVIPACILSLIILILLGFLHLNNLQDNYQDTNNKTESYNKTEDNNNLEKPISIEDIHIALNKMKYQKYIQHKKNKLGNIKDFGYSILPGTNPDTLGFCPLGKFYQGKFTGNSQDVKTKCKSCFNCQSKLGYYVSGGCLGDKDVKCKFGKVPFDVFIKSHEQKSPLHSQLPLYHKHKNKNKQSSYGENIHTHY